MEAPKTVEYTRDINEAATKAREVIYEEEEPKGDENDILDAFVDDKNMDMSETDRRCDKEEELLKRVLVIEKTENANDRTKEK